MTGLRVYSKYPGAEFVSAPTHPLLRLSEAGIYYAARLRHLPIVNLTKRIYGYYGLPIRRTHQPILQDWTDVADWLGLKEGSKCVRALSSIFVATADPVGWMHWRRPSTPNTLLHKLYISPRLESLPELFPLLVEIFDTFDVPAFKIGVSARVLARPDKFVAYFANREHLLVVGDELTSTLRGVPAHGVPFTAPIDTSGLLSWGYDPGIKGESWRLWIAQMLAMGIVGAPLGSVEETVRHARQILKSAGVDPNRWEPLAGACP